MTAVPVRVGETGSRSFCTDASGVICSNADGSEPAVVKGECPKNCEMVR